MSENDFPSEDNNLNQPHINDSINTGVNAYQSTYGVPTSNTVGGDIHNYDAAYRVQAQQQQTVQSEQPYQSVPSVSQEGYGTQAETSRPQQVSGTIPMSETTTAPIESATVMTSSTPAKKEKLSVPFVWALVFVIAAALAAWGGTLLALNAFDAGNDVTTTPAVTTTIVSDDNDDAVAEDLTLANKVAEKATPSVVCIYTYTTQPQYTDIYSLLMNGGVTNTEESSEPVLSGLGSGIIISSDGYIMTNNHVVEGADTLKVNVGDETYDAEIVGTDPSSDIAVIKVDAKDLPAIEAANSDDLKVGDWTMAIGAPYGYEETCTTGIISALNRSTEMAMSSGLTIYSNLIQTDASINSGNSGGALVDSNAKLIGMNTLISSTSGDSAGIGFAIPSNYALNIAHQLMDKGVAAHAFLGVNMADTESGVVVTKVTEGSGAANAGIVEGDFIILVDGEEVESGTDLSTIIRKHAAGDEITITVKRAGEQQDITVTLGDDSEAVAAQQEQQKQQQDKQQSDGHSYSYKYNDSGRGNSGYNSFRDLLEEYFGD